MKLRLPFLLALGLAASTALAGDPVVLFDMETVLHQPTTTGPQKTPIGEVTRVEGQVGRACRFRFEPDARGGFFTASVRATPAWDEAAGLSFWVQGDGSESWGGLELIDSTDYALRYGYCFPIRSTQWRKITVPWRDLVPELPKGPFVDPKTGYAPSRFGNLWFGKWYYWGDYPACSFAIDEIALEPTLELDAMDSTPTAMGTPRLLAKLRSRQPVTIVTLGDSLSDKRHWANRDVLWSEVLAAKLKEAFGSEVRRVNPALGGTQLTQNLVLMPRWLQETPEPDLVTIWFGYNDWDGGARGPDWREKLRFAVDRVRRLTKGRAEVLLMTPCPALARWDTMEELVEATRDVAVEKRTGLADVSAAFHEEGVDEARRAALYAWDKTHLGEAGHRLAAATVFQAILGIGAQSPMADAVAVWHLGDTRDASGKNSALTIHGDVRLGVELEGEERVASLARGGDGRAAVFEGGWLSAGQGSDDELNLTGKTLTIALRLRDPEGTWRYPIFSKHGGHSRLVYNVFATKLGGRDVLGAEIGSTKNEGILQTTVPIPTLADEHAWHDVVVRLDGAKMELFVDGRCVDEDFLLGELRQDNRLPVLIGAQAVDDERVEGGFRGWIDHVCLWDRALSPEEIVALSGGVEAVQARERTDSGDERMTLQYWRSPNNYFVGDCMPFFHDGTFHFVYLLDRNHHASKNHLGAHQWAQATTRDLVDWKHQPLMLGIDEPWEGSICTGSTMFQGGTYYATYSTRASGLRFPAGNQYLNVATSPDGIHFEKAQPNPLNAPPRGFDPTHWRDPFVRYDPEGGLFHVLITARDLERGGCLAHLVSKDMKELEYREPLLYTRDYPGTGDEPECADWFTWGDWSYLIYNGCYLISKEPFGPWRLPESYRLDGSVMKTAPFTGNRRIGVAWISHVGWGFRAIFREAVQRPDGTLGWKLVPEMNPRTGEPLVLVEPGRLKGRGEVRLAGLPRDGRLTLTVAMGDDPAPCGLRFRDGEGRPGLELRLDPAGGTIQLGSSRKRLPELARRAHRVEVYLKDEIIDVCVDDLETLIVCEPPRPGTDLVLWSESSTAELRDLEVRPLAP